MSEGGFGSAHAKGQLQDPLTLNKGCVDATAFANFCICSHVVVGEVTMRHSLSLLLLICLGTVAQGQTRCVEALIQNRASLNVHDVSSLATLRLLQQSSGRDSGWSASIGVPIDGVPVSLGANGTEKATNSYFEKSTLNWTQDRLVSVATQTLPQTAVEAYQTCIRGTSNGLLVTVSDARADALTVTVKYQVPSDSARIADGQVSVLGGSILNGFPTRWAPGSSYSAIITRQPQTDFRIIANVGGWTDTAFVAYVPPPAEFVATPVGKSQLFLGLTPNVNAGEIANNSAHKGGTNVPYGFAIEEDDQFSGAALYVGMTPNVNAGMINTSEGNWRGGATTLIGYAIKPGQQKPADHPLYVGVSPPRCAGAVANNPNHQGCEMALVGYSYEPR